MSPENINIIMPSLKLQGDIKMYLISIGIVSPLADNISYEITHMTNISDVVKPEIRDIYEKADELDF